MSPSRPRKVRSPKLAPDKTETRRQRFERLAIPRMNRALTSIRLIGNLASSQYETTPADIAAMRETLYHAIDETLRRFEKRKPEFARFSLPADKSTVAV